MLPTTHVSGGSAASCASDMRRGETSGLRGSASGGMYDWMHSSRTLSGRSTSKKERRRDGDHALVRLSAGYAKHRPVRGSRTVTEREQWSSSHEVGENPT